MEVKRKAKEEGFFSWPRGKEEGVFSVPKGKEEIHFNAMRKKREDEEDVSGCFQC